MHIGLAESDVIILNDGIEKGCEEAVGFRIGSINTNAGVQIFTT